MKTACTVQCPQCPFRKTALNGWLGSYTPSTVFESIWKGQPFFCHTKVNYASDKWAERAAKGGKLCLGGLVFAGKMGAPDSEVTDSEVLAARRANRDRKDVECMGPVEFAKHHREGALAEAIKARGNAAPRKVAKKPSKPVPPTPEEIDAEVAELKRLAPLIRQQSSFGDDNRYIIDAEIRALKDAWSEDDAYDEMPDNLDAHRARFGDDECEEVVEEECAKNREALSGVIAAIEWTRTGVERPSDGWQHLVD